MAKQLLPTFKPLRKGMMLPTYGDFAALTLCNQELHNVGLQGSFLKLCEEGCIERNDLWNEKWAQILQA